MALTNGDILKISELFNDGFEKIILPTLHSMETRLTEIESNYRVMKDDLHNYVEDADKKFVKNASDIGYYFNLCARKNDVAAVKKRVKKLELARS